MHHAASIGREEFLDTGSGKQRRLINVSEIAREKGPEYCTALLGIYVFPGKDATSAFKGKDKIDPLKKLNANPLISEKNGQFPMISAAKLRHLHVSFLDIQEERV